MIMHKTRKSKSDLNLLFFVAVFAMLLMIYAIAFTGSGSILQKTLILISASVLLFVATKDNQKVLQALQLIVMVGAAFGFLQLTAVYALATMLLVSILTVVYLFRIDYYRKEPIGVVGSLGSTLFAIGLAFNTG